MKRNRVVIITIFSIFLGLVLGFRRAEAATLDVKALTRNEYFDSSGTSHGKYHDKNDFGKVMKKGSKIKISASKEITLQLLTNDSNTEKKYKINSKEQTITVEHDCTPFMENPVNGSNIEVNYEFSGDVQDLAIFNSGDDQEEFLNNWEKSKSPYALFKGKKFQLFLPFTMFNSIKNMSSLNAGFKDIQTMINHYDNDLFPLYEKLTKLDNSSPENKLDENRFFLKNDAHGAGGAYYSANWTADSEGNGNGIKWLQEGWGAKHEIGHGFQNDLMRQMGMGEVSNNILATYYDYQRLGKEADTKSWMFNYGQKDTIENNLSNKLKSEKKFSDLDVREKLVLIYFLLDKMGSDGISQINESSRNSEMFKLFDDKNELLGNKLLMLADTKGYDFSKVLDEYSLETNMKTHFYKEHVSKKSSVVDNIASLIAPENREKVLNQLIELNPEMKSGSIYNLVTPSQLAPLKLRGTAYLPFEYQIPDELINTNVNIYDGDKLVATKKITDKVGVVIEDLPLGTYRVEFEGLKLGMFVSNPYVTVSQDEVYKYKPIYVAKTKVSKLAMNNKIVFKGYSDVPFMNIDTAVEQDYVKVTTDFFKAIPHSYFAGEKYASVTIFDGAEMPINKTIMGDSSDVFKQEYMTPGLSIVEDVNIFFGLYHAEPKHRLSIINSMDKELVLNSKNKNNLQLSSYGLVNMEANEASTTNLKELISFFGDKYLVDSNVNSHKNALIEDLYIAIDALPSKDKEQYVAKYKTLFDLYK